MLLKEKIASLENKKGNNVDLADYSFDAIIVHDNGYTVDVNQTFVDITGIPKHEIIGKNVIQLFVPKKYHKRIFEIMNKEHTLPYEIEAFRKDGSTFPAEIEAKNIDFNGKKYRIAVIRDITKKKQIK